MRRCVHTRPLRHALAAALVLALPACRSEAEPATRQVLGDAASLPQACAYDGGRLTVDPQGLAFGRPGAGVQVVAEIMKYTGLPQNFEVLPHPEVPNAAAVILPGPDGLPRRVIAYNEAFMAEVARATAHSDWAPVSIMAHEIGHHLSGHTLQPGGSQPPTELEADAFSGFVLNRMGASLADAQRAMNALVPEQDGPTHPGRGKRVRAIAEGWQRACAQVPGGCADALAQADTHATARSAQPGATSPAADATADTTAAPTQAAPRAGAASVQRLPVFGELDPPDASPTPPATTAAESAAPVDVLPAPDPAAIPAKFGRFVVDELGVLDAETRAAAEADFFRAAQDDGVEVSTLLVKSLHGLDADAYARTLLRQLRVGKQDLGNGAVLVVAPNESAVGLALGAGLQLEMRDYLELERERLRGFLDIGLPYCRPRCNADQTGLLLEAGRHIAEQAGQWDFRVRYPSLEALLAAQAASDAARARGEAVEPEQDPTWRAVVRVEAQVEVLEAAQSPLADRINPVHADAVGPALLARSGDGRALLVYADPAHERRGDGTLRAGGRYVFLLREQALSANPEDPLGFDLIAADALP